MTISCTCTCADDLDASCRTSAWPTHFLSIITYYRESPLRNHDAATIHHAQPTVTQAQTRFRPHPLALGLGLGLAFAVAWLPSRPMVDCMVESVVEQAAYLILHFHIFTFSHFHIFTFSHFHIFTFPHFHIFTFSHFHISTFSLGFPTTSTCDS